MPDIQAIRSFDIENAFVSSSVKPSTTVSVWFGGCSKRCVGCWNPETWSKKNTVYYTVEELAAKVASLLKEGYPKRLALLGGDPLEDSFPNQSSNNAQDTYLFLKKLKESYPGLEVICWTGYTWEECLELPRVKRILEEGLITTLIDGRFKCEYKTEGKLFGSFNQRVIDVEKSLLSGVVIEVPNEMLE